MASVRGAASFHACDVVPSVSDEFSVVTDVHEARALIASLRDSLRVIAAPFEPNPPSSDMLVQHALDPLYAHLASQYRLDARFSHAAINTVDHIFSHARAAVYVLIVNEHLRVFLPLCNTSFTNHWDLNRLQPRVAADDARQPGFVTDPRQWWSNAHVICNVRAVSPDPAWSFDLLSTYRDALVDALRAVRARGHHIAWCEFVLNKRDHPLVRSSDDAHPYMSGPYPDAVGALLTRAHPMLPFVSPYTQLESFVDLPFPPAADLQTSADAHSATAALQIRDRIPRAVWRGSATGWGVTAATNPRIAIAYKSLARPDLIDARLVGANERDKVNPFTGVMERATRASFEGLDVGRQHFLTQTQQDAYMMQVYIPGHAAASRLGALLRSGSVVLLVRGHPQLPHAPLDMWYTRSLVAGVHYIPVQHDLSDLEDAVQSVLADTQRAQTIADAAHAFAQQYMTRDFAVQHVIPCVLQRITYAENHAFGDDDAACPPASSMSDIRDLLLVDHRNNQTPT